MDSDPFQVCGVRAGDSAPNEKYTPPGYDNRFLPLRRDLRGFSHGRLAPHSSCPRRTRALVAENYRLRRCDGEFLLHVADERTQQTPLGLSVRTTRQSCSFLVHGPLLRARIQAKKIGTDPEIDLANSPIATRARQAATALSNVCPAGQRNRGHPYCGKASPGTRQLVHRPP